MSIRPALDRRVGMNASSSPCLSVLLSLTLSMALAAGAGCSRDAAGKQGTAPVAAAAHGHLPVNGVDYYYEIHGTGEPLLLLHGGLMSVDMFAAVMPALSAHRQVIAIDLQGHGRSTLGDRELSLIDMGDDLAAILAKL